MIPPGYIVLANGTIIGKRGKPLKGFPNPGGYLLFNTYQGGKYRTFSFHQVVCEAFHGPRPTQGHQVCHGDGDLRNNRADNLRWGTSTENHADQKRHGTRMDNRGEKHPNAKLTAQQVRAIREQYAAGGVTQIGLAAEYGVSYGTIGPILLRETWKHVEPGPAEQARIARGGTVLKLVDEKTREMVAMREAGKTWKAIGDHFGMSIQGAYDRVRKARQS